MALLQRTNIRCSMAGQALPRKEALPLPDHAEKCKEALPRQAQSQWPKYAALCCVVLHQTAAVFTMRYSQVVRKTAGRPPYLSTVTVFTTEMAKLLGSFAIVVVEEGGPMAACQAVVDAFQGSLAELLRLTVPALLYSIQNNLLFVALAHLTAAVYTVSYQLKTLTTALFSVMVLRRELSRMQWLALAALSAGVGLLQLPAGSTGGGGSGGSSREGTTRAPQVSVSMLGMGAVCGASLTSGFCGVYMEKLLKQSKMSLWMRNVQLALVGAPVSLICALWADYSQILEGGFLQGFDGLVWAVVGINALGGLAIAAVLRYADNIVKCFATAVAVLVSCLLSNLMGELVLSSLFVAGTSLVAVATVMYGLGSDRGPLGNLRLETVMAMLFPSNSKSKLKITATFVAVAILSIFMVVCVAIQLDIELPHVLSGR